MLALQYLICSSIHFYPKEDLIPRMEHMDLIRILFFHRFYSDDLGFSFDLMAAMDNYSLKFFDCLSCFLYGNQKFTWASLSSYCYLIILYFVNVFNLDIYSHFYLSLGSIYFLKLDRAVHLVLNN